MRDRIFLQTVCKRWFFAAFFVLLIGVLHLLFYPAMKRFLSITHEIQDSEIFLIEGWISERSMDAVSKMLRNRDAEMVVTTGYELPEYFLISMNGDYVLYPGELNHTMDSLLVESITPVLYGELGGAHASNYTFFINNKNYGSFNAQTVPPGETIHYNGYLRDIDSVVVRFNNDAMGPFGDHNLYFKGLLLNHNILLPYYHIGIYRRMARGWEKTFDLRYGNYAGRAKNFLVENGICPEKIIALPNLHLSKNETIASALDFKQWIVNQDDKDLRIEIMTESVHSLRTLMTYRIIVGGSHAIGIKSFPVHKHFRSPVEEFLNVYKELYGLNIYIALATFHRFEYYFQEKF